MTVALDPPAVTADPAPEYWNTLTCKRSVLVAVHTTTTLCRLADIVMLLEDDPRVQLVFTLVPDQLGADVEHRLRDWEVRVIPWRDACTRQFDLAIAASLHQLEDVQARAKFAVPHGAGYNKVWPRELLDVLEDVPPPVYGLDRQSLMPGGRRVFDALVLPHPDHVRTLARQCPEMLVHAVVAGDPCYDRLLVSMRERDYYRSRLGVRSGQVLVAVTSTWGPRSLLATQWNLLLRLPSELPANHRVIATLHPAVWSAHGPRQIKAWLRDARDSGVDLVDAGEDWRGLIAAADVAIADHGSLAVYAAGVGIPLLLSHFAQDQVDPNSVMAQLAMASPVLRPDLPLFLQLMAAREAQHTQWQAVRHRISEPKGLSAEILRQTLYRLLQLPEPPAPAEWPAAPVPRLCPQGVPA